MQLDNTAIVITGGAQGLGLAIAKAVLEAGASVALVDIDEDALNKTKTQLTDADCEVFVCDIRDLEQVRSTVARLSEWQLKLDVLINNAGMWTDNNLEILDPQRRKVAFDTNALGPIQFTNEVLPVLKRQRSGHIFNVISTSGDAMTPSGDSREWQTYSATKWAMTGFTKALRESLVGTGIKVSGFFPGGIDTNLYENVGWESGAHGQPWMMNADDVAAVVLFALTRPADVLIESLTVTKFTG
jgi:2-dehydro-3-deoxy-L-rhamnonate dehydrogenase (NAD+)